MLEHSGFLQKAVQVGDEVIFVMAVYETFPAVVHKPALHVSPIHAVCPVVLLQSPVRKRPPKMKVRARQVDEKTSLILLAHGTVKWWPVCLHWQRGNHKCNEFCGSVTVWAFCGHPRHFYTAYPRSDSESSYTARAAHAQVQIQKNPTCITALSVLPKAKARLFVSRGKTGIFFFPPQDP